MARTIFGVLLAVALALPWGTAASVKIYLDSQGQPTYPWIYFINPWTLGVFVIPTTLYWSSPLLVLTLLWRFSADRERIWRMNRGDRAIIIVSAFALGCLGAVRLYVPLFWDIEHSAVSAARLPLSYLPFVLVGAAIGCLLVLFRVRRRSRTARAPLA